MQATSLRNKYELKKRSCTSPQRARIGTIIKNAVPKNYKKKIIETDGVLFYRFIKKFYTKKLGFLSWEKHLANIFFLEMLRKTQKSFYDNFFCPISGIKISYKFVLNRTTEVTNFLDLKVATTINF